MTSKITADRGSAITLTAILTKFKNGNNFTVNTFSKLCKEERVGTNSQIREIMKCLKDIGCISNHGRHGNKCHIPQWMHTGHIMSELYKRGIISWI